MNTPTVNVLNDLIHINNDRIAGYQKAINKIGNVDIDLNALFSNCVNESEEYREQLIHKIREYNSIPNEDNTIAGKVYRLWVELKATFSGNTRQEILESCEHSEEIMQKVYASALAESGYITAEVTQLINEQKGLLKNTYDLIKKYKDISLELKNV